MSAVGQVDAGISSNYTNKTTNTAKTSSTAKSEYGNTIGDVQLSDKGAKYYEQLKSKYSGMDFVLVSNDEVEGAEQKAAKYANSNRTLVLIDAEKVEKMAEDAEYRKKYENIIGSANMQLDQMKQSLESGTMANVKTFGIKVDDHGNSSFFAVVDKSLAAQKERITQNREKKAEEKKAADKKAAEEKLEGVREKGRTDKTSGEELETVTASSVDELIKKLNNSYYMGLSDNVLTEQEKLVGSTMDLKL